VTKSAQDRQGKIILASLTAVVVAVLATYMYVKSSRVRLDAANCPVEADGKSRAPSPTAVILIDQSEPFTRNQQQLISQKIVARLRDKLGVGDRVLVFGFNKTKYYDFEPIFAQCIPPKDVNPFTGNRRRVQQFLETRFAQPLRRAVEGGITQTSGDESPIIEALQAVGRSAHVESPKAHLYIVSDLLQHRAQRYSHYGRPAEYAQFKSLPYAQEVFPNLRGWDVSVYYVARFGAGKNDQGPEHLKFWQQLFHEAGASIKDWEPIS
jgi:hypothetical protein